MSQALTCDMITGVSEIKTPDNFCTDNMHETSTHAPGSAVDGFSITAMDFIHA